MDKVTQSWIDATKRALRNLQENYNIHRGLVLTEGDLECHMFSELLRQPEFSGYHPSRDRAYSTSFIHSQVTWFKPAQMSGFEVDITICDPSRLRVVKQEMLEKWPSKGFVYDGQCVAIELKFIRDHGKASLLAQEDFLKLRDVLIPAKMKNIEDLKYRISSKENTAFVSIVGCKDDDTFRKAKYYLGRHLSDETRPCPENLLICIFYQGEVIWDKQVFINAYKVGLTQSYGFGKRVRLNIKIENPGK